MCIFVYKLTPLFRANVRKIAYNTYYTVYGLYTYTQCFVSSCYIHSIARPSHLPFICLDFTPFLHMCGDLWTQFDVDKVRVP